MSSSQTPSTFGLHWSQALRAALAAKVASLPPSGVQGVVAAIYGREILALKRTWNASSIDFSSLNDLSCERVAEHLATRARPPPRRWGPREAPDQGRGPAATSSATEIIEISDDEDAAKVDGEVAGTPRKRRDEEVAENLLAAEARLARVTAAMPGDVWSQIAGYGGVGVVASLRCCSAQLRLGPNDFASVFADATSVRFPAMAVVAANGRESDHEAIYKSLHEAVASRLSPRPLVLLAPPLPQRDQFAFTVEIIHFDKVVISTTASIPENFLRLSRLYTPPLSLASTFLLTPNWRDQDGRVRNPVSARVFCVNMTTGHAALIYNEALTQKTVCSQSGTLAFRYAHRIVGPCCQLPVRDVILAEDAPADERALLGAVQFQGLYHQLQSAQHGNFIKLSSDRLGRLVVEFTVHSKNATNSAFLRTHHHPILESLLIYLTLFLDFNIPLRKSV